jgi:hypothetical protein
LGKKLKIVIGVVVVVLFIGVPIVLSFVAPGSVLKADTNNITGVTQFFVLKEDGGLYTVVRNFQAYFNKKLLHSGW